MRQGRLVELEAVEDWAILMDKVELCKVLADVVANAQFRAFRRHDLVEPRVLKLFLAKWVIAFDLTAELFVRVDFRQLEDFLAVSARSPKAMDDFLHRPTSSTNANVFVAAWAVLVQLQPVFNTPLTEKLIAIITLLCLAGNLETDLAEDKTSKIFANFIACDGLGVVAYAS